MTPPFDPFTRWREISDGSGGAASYQERFDELEAKGIDVHGEARLVAELLGRPPARVLDAGCGTGRVATELGRLGFDCTGVDADLAMLEVARERDRSTFWIHQDLSTLYLRSQMFDLVLLAGNVIPLLAPLTLDQTMLRIADHVQPGGLVLCGLGLDAAHLPDGCPVTPWADYERACTAAELVLVDHWSSWEREPWSDHCGYVVALHRRPD